MRIFTVLTFFTAFCAIASASTHSGLSCENGGSVTCVTGICYNDKCICNEGYVTYGSTDTQCNYEQKDKTAPLILAIIPATTGLGLN